ncbi:KilA-N domain-containing protein [Escherichia coli]|uniref:KilA-N domain-containing protein n=1 Tax=Escherichia coli TaxID=562 RepID=UPI000BE5B938|nr:KilA-N domain-containing protein [Escherichia coli]
MIINGIEVREREGLFNLTDIWKAAGKPTGKRPNRFLETCKSLISFIAANECNDKNQQVTKVWRKDEGTFGNELIVLRYAAYINVALEYKVYKYFQHHHEVKEEVNKALEVKADVLDRMCDKANKLTITQATAELFALTGVTLSPQRLNALLKSDGYKFSHWYNNNGGGWRCDVLTRGFAAYKFEIDPKGNKHRGCCLTSRGVQYLAEYLNRYYCSHPLRK